MVTNAERLEVLVAIQLFKIGVGDTGKLGFILWPKDHLRITTEIRSGHGYDMGLVPFNQRPNNLTKPVFLVSTGMVEFVNGKDAAIKRFWPQFVEGKPQCGMGADEDFVRLGQERLEGLNLTFFYRAGYRPRS